jgi:hypothetical protein
MIRQVCALFLTLWQLAAPSNLRLNSMSLPASDSFSYSDGYLVTVSSGLWSDVTGNSYVRSHLVGGRYDVVGRARWTDSFNNNQYSEITFGNTRPAGPMVRCANSVDTGYYVLAYPAGGWLRLYKVISGSQTLLGSDPCFVSMSAGDVVRLEASGTTITVKVNGTVAESVTDSDIASGYAGLFTYDSTTGISLWSGGNLAGGGGISIPVAMYLNRRRRNQ